MKIGRIKSFDHKIFTRGTQQQNADDRIVNKCKSRSIIIILINRNKKL
jgi:hypothetical protein